MRNCRRIAAQRFLDHFAGVDGRSVDGAAKERNEFDDAVAVVEEEDCEDLVVLNGKPESQVVARGARVRERGALANSAREDGASGVQDLVRGGPPGDAFGVAGEKVD